METHSHISAPPPPCSPKTTPWPCCLPVSCPGGVIHEETLLVACSAIPAKHMRICVFCLCMSALVVRVCVRVCVCVCVRARVRVCSWDTQESGRGMFNRLQAPVACSICGVEIQAPIVPTPSSPSLAPPEQAALVAASSNCRFQPATPIDSRTVRGMRDPRGRVFLARMSGLH